MRGEPSFPFVSNSTIHLNLEEVVRTDSTSYSNCGGKKVFFCANDERGQCLLTEGANHRLLLFITENLEYIAAVLYIR
jgi:hypothetical protein